MIERIQLIPLFINRRCGRWAHTSTIHIIRLIPSVVTHSITYILTEFEEANPPIDITYPNIPHKFIPLLFHAHRTLLFLIRVMIGNGVITVINTHTTKHRWRYTIPPLVNKFQTAIDTFYEDVLTLRNAPIDTTIRIALTLVISHLQHILRYEFQQLQQQTIIEYQHMRDDTDGNDWHSQSNTVVAYDRALPHYMRTQIYEPYIPNPARLFTSDDLFRAFYHPYTEPDIQNITQYSTPSSATINLQHTTSLISSQSYHSVPHSSAIHNPNTLVFYEARETLDTEDTMATRPIARSQREGTPPQTPPQNPASPLITRDSTNDTTITTDTNPQHTAILQATRDIIMQEVQQLTRTIHRTTEETRHHIDQVQRQVDVVRRSWDEQSRSSGRNRSVSDLENTIRPRAILNYPASPTRSRHSDTAISQQTQYDWQDAIEPEREPRRVRYADEHTASQPPPHWTDNIVDAITRKQLPREIDMHYFLTARRRPMLTEQDMERFSRKPPEKLTE